MAKKNKKYIHDSDYLIHVLNSKKEDHSTLRRVGFLLQQYAKKFPQTFAGTQIRDLDPQTPNVELQNQIKTLQTQIAECQKLKKDSHLAEDKRMGEIEKLITVDARETPFIAYTEAIKKLNDLWMECAKHEFPRSIVEGKNIKEPTDQTMCKNLIVKLNSEPEHNFARAIATILQAVHQQHGESLKAILTHPVTSLNPDKYYKWTAATVKRLSPPKQ